MKPAQLVLAPEGDVEKLLGNAIKDVEYLVSRPIATRINPDTGLPGEEISTRFVSVYASPDKIYDIACALEEMGVQTMVNIDGSYLLSPQDLKSRLGEKTPEADATRSTDSLPFYYRDGAGYIPFM